MRDSKRFEGSDDWLLMCGADRRCVVVVVATLLHGDEVEGIRDARLEGGRGRWNCAGVEGAYRVSCADEAIDVDFEGCSGLGLVISLLWSGHHDGFGVVDLGVDKIVMWSLMKPGNLEDFREVRRILGGRGGHDA